MSDILDRYKRLSGIESRLDRLPVRQKVLPPIAPVRKSGLSEETRRLSGMSSPTMRGARELTEADSREDAKEYHPYHLGGGAFSIRSYMTEQTAVDEEAATRAQKYAAKQRTKGFNRNMQKVGAHVGKWKRSVASELKKLRIDPKTVDQTLAGKLMLGLADPKLSAKQLAATVGRHHESVSDDAPVAIDQEFMDAYGDTPGWGDWIPDDERSTALESFRKMAGLVSGSGLPHLASDGGRPRTAINHGNNLLDESYVAPKRSPKTESTDPDDLMALAVGKARAGDYTKAADCYEKAAAQFRASAKAASDKMDKQELLRQATAADRMAEKMRDK